MQVDFCPKHKKYKGVVRPKLPCSECWSIFAMRNPSLIGPTLAELHAASLEKPVDEVSRPRRGAITRR